jgi:glyoxylase-like metal-dependent hydrolase (beta-lactamase superfamily II)
MTVTTLPKLHASEPSALSFAPDVHVRAFLLERAAGDLLVYDAPRAEAGTARVQYLNHWHEPMVGGGRTGLPIAVHEADRAATEKYAAVDRTFSARATLDGDFELIPIPGHTPGATAFLWEGVLFTGDSLLLDGDEWIVAVLESSDRAAYLDSLRLIRDLDFKVLVPWSASANGPWFADAGDRRARLDAIIERVSAGANR